MKPSSGSSMAKTTLVSDAMSCSYQRVCSAAVTGRARSTRRATSGSFTKARYLSASARSKGRRVTRAPVYMPAARARLGAGRGVLAALRGDRLAPLDDAEAVLLGRAHHLLPVVGPRAVLPVGALAAERDVATTALGVLAAPPLKHRPRPDVVDRLLADVAEVGAPGDVEAAHLDLAAAVDVQAVERIGAGLAFGLVEVRRGIRRVAGIDPGVRAPGQELALDDLVHADLVPEPDDVVHLVADDILVDHRDHDVRAGGAAVPLGHHVADGRQQAVPVEAGAYDGVGSRVGGVDAELDLVEPGRQEAIDLGGRQEAPVRVEPDARADRPSVLDERRHVGGMHHGLAATGDSEERAVLPTLVRDLPEERRVHERRVGVLQTDVGVGLRVRAVRALRVAGVDGGQNHHLREVLGAGLDAVSLPRVHD